VIHSFQNLVLVYIVPATTAVACVFLSQKHEVLGDVLISLGAGAIGLLLGLLTLGLAVFELGGTEASGRPTSAVFYTGWALSIAVAMIISGVPHVWEFPGWVATPLRWLGGFIVGLGLAFLLAFLSDVLSRVENRS
jgi:hypothetical protein